MNYSIATSPTSSQFLEIPSGVYDVNSLIAGCETLGISTDRETIRRFRRGLDLHENGAVQQVEPLLYIVQSQNDPDTSYLVEDLESWSCDCPDFARPHIPICKHIIAVQLWQHEYNEYLDSCCPTPDYCEPTQYFEWDGKLIPF